MSTLSRTLAAFRCGALSGVGPCSSRTAANSVLHYCSSSLPSMCSVMQAGLQGIELVNITSQYGLHYRIGHAGHNGIAGCESTLSSGPLQLAPVLRLTPPAQEPVPVVAHLAGEGHQAGLRRFSLGGGGGWGGLAVDQASDTALDICVHAVPTLQSSMHAAHGTSSTNLQAQGSIWSLLNVVQLRLLQA